MTEDTTTPAETTEEALPLNQGWVNGPNPYAPESADTEAESTKDATSPASDESDSQKPTEVSLTPEEQAETFDLSDPNQKAIYDSIAKKLNDKNAQRGREFAEERRQWQERMANLEGQLETLGKQPAAPAEPERAEDTRPAFFSDPLSLDPFSEDSSLYGVEGDLDARIDAIVQQRINSTVNVLQAQQTEFEVAQAAQVEAQAAQKTLVEHFEALKTHPEWAKHLPRIQELAADEENKALATKYPKAFIAIVEKETGLTIPTQESAPAPPTQPAGPRVVANPALTAVPRSTPARVATAPPGKLTRRQAIELAVDGVG